jgi:hypothetical protein
MLILEVDLDEADEGKAVRVARKHFRRTGPASRPVNWNRIGGKWRRVSAEEWIPDAEIAIMELIDANDLLDEAGIGVKCVSLKGQASENTLSSRGRFKGKASRSRGAPSLNTTCLWRRRIRLENAQGFIKLRMNYPEAHQPYDWPIPTP